MQWFETSVFLIYIRFINFNIYQSKEKCHSNDIKCENGGFVNKNCECFCPRDFYGKRCEKIQESYLG